MRTLVTGSAPASDSSGWDAVLAWLGAAGTDLLAVGGVVVGAIVVAWVLRFVIRRVVNRIVSRAKAKANVNDTQALERSPLAEMRVVQRTRTLGSILQNIVNVAVIIVAFLLIVYIIAPDALGSVALLSAALGAGLGFGAQNIVKDVLNGIFIVSEDQIGIGDVVDVGLASGIVEYVSVRVTHVRDVNGTLWYVRNGEITRIGNMSQGWSRVIVDAAVSADADLDEVETLMLAAAKDLAATPKWRSRVIDEPEVWGLESVDGDALVVRIVMKTRAGAKEDVARELRMRIRRAMHDAQIALPSLGSVVPTGMDAARRVRGSAPPTTKPTPVPAPSEKGRWRLKKRDEPAPPPALHPDDAAAGPRHPDIEEETP